MIVEFKIWNGQNNVDSQLLERTIVLQPILPQRDEEDRMEISRIEKELTNTIQGILTGPIYNQPGTI